MYTYQSQSICMGQRRKSISKPLENNNKNWMEASKEVYMYVCVLAEENGDGEYSVGWGECNYNHST